MALKTECALALPRALVGDFFRQSRDAIQIHSDVVAMDLDVFCEEMGKNVVVAPRHLLEKGGALSETFVHFASYVTVIDSRQKQPGLSDETAEKILDELTGPNHTPEEVYNKYVAGKEERGDVVRHHHIYSRTPKGGEALLHGAVSIGFGGHVNPVGAPRDQDEEDLCEWLIHCLEEGAAKELTEELLGEDWPTNSLLELTHVVWDQSNEVGNYHLAALGFFLDDLFDQRSQQETEVELLDPISVQFPGDGWVIENDEHGLTDRLESWSRILLTMMDQGIIQTDL